jgi:Ca2+-binding EF-hand superfamily protein
MKCNLLFSLSLVAALAAATVPAWAQSREERSRDDRGNREERGGGGGEDRGGRRGFDPTDFLRRMDANGNGLIEPDEASGRGKEFIERMASRAGLDPKQPLSIEKLAGSSQSSGEERRDSRREEEKPKAPVITSSAASTVAGFGVSVAVTAPPGFGAATVEKTSRYKRPLEERFEKKVIDRVDDMLKSYDDDKNGAIDYKTDEKNDVRWSIPPEDSDLNKDGKLDREELCYRIAKILGSKERDGKDSKGGSSENNEQRQKVRRYAEGLMKQYDENKNGVLDKEEWAKMSGDPKRADRNEDGIITLDELADRLGAYGSDNGSSSQTASNERGGGRFGSGGDSRGGGERGGGDRGGSGGYGGYRRGDREASSEKKPIRVLTPTERLPKGLPSWFTRNDADADGQVTMSEYSTSYNDTTAAEFAKYDLDGDGIITPQECLQGEKAKSSSSSSGSGSSSRYGKP